MITKHNEEALQMIMSSDYNIRDKFLQEIRFFYDEYIPCLRLSISNHSGEGIVYDLEFRELVRFDFYFEENYSTYIEDYKTARLNNGQYYFSLDPYNSMEEVSKDDQDIIIAKSIKLQIM